jgi:hypothetical protein
VLTNNSALNGGAAILSTPPVTNTAAGYVFADNFSMGGYRLNTTDGTSFNLYLGGASYDLSSGGHLRSEARGTVVRLR